MVIIIAARTPEDIGNPKWGAGGEQSLYPNTLFLTIDHCDIQLTHDAAEALACRLDIAIMDYRHRAAEAKSLAEAKATFGDASESPAIIKIAN